MTVTDWPSYLIRRIPPQTREKMTARAAQDDISLADVVRLALCARYQLECDPASFGYQPSLDVGNPFLIVRIQPDLWQKMRQETHGKYGATKTLVFEALDDYLEAP